MLTSVFGISIKYEAWNHQDFLPVYIAGKKFEGVMVSGFTKFNII